MYVHRQSHSIVGGYLFIDKFMSVDLQAGIVSPVMTRGLCMSFYYKASGDGAALTVTQVWLISCPSRTASSLLLI